MNELDNVVLLHDVDGFRAGTPGTIVSVYPEEDAFTVELFDGNYETLDVVFCHAGDLEPAS